MDPHTHSRVPVLALGTFGPAPLPTLSGCPETRLRPLVSHITPSPARCREPPGQWSFPRLRADGQAQAAGDSWAVVPSRLVAVMSSHSSTPSEAIPGSSNGNVNLIHGHSPAAAGPEDRHAGRLPRGKGRCCQRADPLLGRRWGRRKASGPAKLILTTKMSLQDVGSATQVTPGKTCLKLER